MTSNSRILLWVVRNKNTLDKNLFFCAVTVCMKKRRLCTKVFLRKEEDVTLFSVRGEVKSNRVFFHWRIYCFEIRFLCLCMKKIVGLATLHITIEFEYILLSIVKFLWSREENLGLTYYWWSLTQKLALSSWKKNEKLI